MAYVQLDEKGVIEPCASCGQKNRIAYSQLGNIARCGQCKAPLPSVAEPLAVAEPLQFQTLTSSAGAVLVDFYTDWCGPCKMMAPELERVAQNAQGRFVVAKVNTEGSPEIAQQFAISAIPTLVLFSRGEEVARIQGARSERDIVRFVEQGLLSKAA